MILILVLRSLIRLPLLGTIFIIFFIILDQYLLIIDDRLFETHVLLTIRLRGVRHEKVVNFLLHVL